MVSGNILTRNHSTDAALMELGGRKEFELRFREGDMRDNSGGMLFLLLSVWLGFEVGTESGVSGNHSLVGRSAMVESMVMSTHRLRNPGVPCGSGGSLVGRAESRGEENALGSERFLLSVHNYFSNSCSDALEGGTAFGVWPNSA